MIFKRDFKKALVVAMVWVPLLAAVLWLWPEPGGRCEVQNGSHLVEYSAEGFSEKLQSGSSMFVYFGHRGKWLNWRTHARTHALTQMGVCASAHAHTRTIY